MVGTINKLGVLGTVASAALGLGCCAPQVLGPLAGVLFAGGVLDRVPLDWQLPLLYGSLAVALVGFGLGWRRHRRLAPLLLFLPGAGALVYSLHEVFDVSLLKVGLWTAFGLLLAAAAWDAWLSFRARGAPEGSLVVGGVPMIAPAPQRPLKGYLLLGVAFVTCPCHLPILLAILAGTGLAGALSQYFGLAFAALSVVFVVSLLLGLKALKGATRGEPDG